MMRRIEYQILDMITEYIGAHGYGPSFSEIMDALNIATRSTVKRCIKELCEAGELISDHPGEDRAYILPEKEEQKSEWRVHTLQTWGL